MNKTDRMPAIAAVAVFTSAMLFAAYTQHAWEDWYITYKASKNLALGNGLVFTPGQKVHSFTSPLGTLIPAFLCWAVRGGSDEVVLWLFRLISAAGLGGAAYFSVRLLRNAGYPFGALLFLMLALALDFKSVDFSINGMETGLLLLFLSLTFCSGAGTGRKAWVLVAIGWAGLMWTTPDAFVLIGASTLSQWFFTSGEVPNLKERFMRLSKTACLALALYMPWILFAWFYYGSPIPHTIIAKGLSFGNSLGFLDNLGFASAFPTKAIRAVFAPPYMAQFAGWPAIVVCGSAVLGIFSFFLWPLKFIDPVGRAASLSALVSGLYFGITPQYPWYLPGTTFLSCLALASWSRFLISNTSNHRRSVFVVFFLAAVLCVAVLSGIAGRRALFFSSMALSGFGMLVLLTPARYMRFLAAGGVAAGIAWMGGTYCLVANQMRQQQQIIELGVRKEIGLFLKNASHSDKETVFLECLGYIGFYSDLKMYDYPGLCSPEMLVARRKLRTNSFDQLIRELKPDWLVLRAGEVENIKKASPDFFDHDYDVVKEFDARATIKSSAQTIGASYLNYDAHFVVFHRR